MHEFHFHDFEPVFDKNSKALILGTFPSVKSREQGFYYGHAQNRFWRVMANILGESIPQTVEEKKAMLLKNHMALWDVAKSCEIVGSSDSSMKNVVANDIQAILSGTEIERIFANGKTAARLYEQLIYPKIEVPIVALPSTSPANASYSIERLTEEWSTILHYVK